MFTFVKCYAISNEATACCQIRTRDIHRLRLKQWLVLGWSLILSFSLPNLHLLSVSLFSSFDLKDKKKQMGPWKVSRDYKGKYFTSNEFFSNSKGSRRKRIEFHVQDFSSFSTKLPSFHINIYCSSTGFYSTKDRIIFLLNFAKKKKEVVEMEGMNIEEIKICTLRGINDPPPESRWNVSFHRCCSTPPSPETAQTNFPNDRDPTISFPRLLKIKYSKYSKTSRKDSSIFFFFPFFGSKFIFSSI